MNIVPAIISGGAGSRLWPLSRETFPKPFITLPDGDTLICRTYARAVALDGASHVVTVTNRELLFLTSDEYARVPASGVKNSFLLEPFPRDTAAAIALAALYIMETDGPQAIVLVLPADHLIPNESAFQDAVSAAAQLAAEGRIVTFGIPPTRAETGYGYMEAEGKTVLRFVEKPDEATAAEYVSSGRYFWNSGMFCFQAQTMVEAMEEFCPEVLAGARVALAASQRHEAKTRTGIEIESDAFAAIPAISIDYAVMEKSKNIGFVATDFDWSDIGSWNSMAELVEEDAQKNRIVGEVRLEATENCFVHGRDRLVCLVGAKDLLVVDTPDALLIAHKDYAQRVKAIYGTLRSEGHEAASLHRTVHRPWGAYTVLEEGERFKLKRIEVRPGARLSLQAHHHRAEHWVVVRGTAKVVNGDKEILLSTNQSTYIPCGHKHRLENPGILPLVMIEVQSGEYLGEDDIVRFDDQYGRA